MRHRTFGPTEEVAAQVSNFPFLDRAKLERRAGPGSDRTQIGLLQTLSGHFLQIAVPGLAELLRVLGHDFEQCRSSLTVLLHHEKLR